MHQSKIRLTRIYMENMYLLFTLSSISFNEGIDNLYKHKKKEQQIDVHTIVKAFGVYTRT